MPVSKHRSKSGGKKSKAAAREKRKPASASSPSAPGRQTTEAAIAALSAAAPRDEPKDALHQAQELIYDAWETPKAAQRIRLAKRALKISDLCADAHCLLADDEAKTLVEARGHYERALAAGEKAAGPQAFKNDAGHFWGILDTRPYMRARMALADCLWQCGERAAAIEHLQDMLRLNPNDNQGVRDPLAAWLLSVRDHDAAEKLLKAYDGDYSACWHYSVTLLAFRKGDEIGSRRCLKKAWEFNPHVPAFLIGTCAIPPDSPGYYSLRSPDEALLYAQEHRENWASTEGALPWLAESIRTLPPPEKD